MLLFSRLPRISPHLWSEPRLNLAKHVAHVLVFCSIIITFFLNVEGLNGSPSSTVDAIDPLDPKAEQPPPPKPEGSSIPQPLLLFLKLLRFLPILALPQVSWLNIDFIL